jgi:hypothetical protein
VVLLAHWHLLRRLFFVELAEDVVVELNVVISGLMSQKGNVMESEESQARLHPFAMRHIGMEHFHAEALQPGEPEKASRTN